MSVSKTMNSHTDSAQSMTAPKVFPGSSVTLQFLLRFQALLMSGLDTGLIMVAFIVSYFLRFHFGPLTELFPPAGGIAPPIDPYLKMALLTGLIWVFLMWHGENYRRDLHHSSSLAEQTRMVLTSGVYSLIFLMVISFLVRQFLLSRLVYGLSFLLAVSLLIMARSIRLFIIRNLDRQKVLLNQILILGNNNDIGRLLDTLKREKPCTGVLGRLIWGEDEAAPNSGDIPTLGTASEIERVWRETPFDHLVVMNHGGGWDPSQAPHRPQLIRALNFCEQYGIQVYTVPDLFDVIVSRREVGSLGGVPMIRLRDSSLHPLYALVKRLMDLVISGGVIALGLPLWTVIALAIKLTSKGPIFYVQKRAGLHGKMFRMYKFRSMVDGADAQLKELVDFDHLEEPVFNIRQDPRVTLIGVFLRRTSLDEIPQLINVLLGSMSVIGPRPERIDLVERYNPYQRRRLKAKPGITGYQQVMSRGDPSLEKRIEYDLWYLKNQSLFLDVFILLKTILVVIRGDGLT